MLEKTAIRRKGSYRVQREALWRRGCRACYYCDRRLTLARDCPNSMTVDHKIPLSRGGYNKPTNYVAACAACNNAKGDMTEADFWQIIRSQRRAA